MAALLVASIAALFAAGVEVYVFAIAYPAFAIVGAREFEVLHALHTSRMTFVIGPALLVAFATNALLAAQRPPPVPAWLAIVAALAGGAILAYTAVVAMPLHARLAASADPAAIVALNATEWIRALATLLQAACDVAMLVCVLREIPRA